MSKNVLMIGIVLLSLALVACGKTSRPIKPKDALYPQTYSVQP